MAKKKQVKKPVKKVKIDEDLVRKVDSLVDEIERTNNFKKITDEDIEELENTLSNKKMDPVKEDTEEIEILGETKQLDLEKPKKKKTKQDLNKTNKYDFKFDDDRLTELDSLDTSFLEGRINNDPKKARKKVKKINDEKGSEVREFSFDFSKFRLPLIIAGLVVLAVVLVGFGSLLQVNTLRQQKAKEAAEIKKQEEKKKQEVKVQSHYLFVGDIFTQDLKASERFSGYHLAVSGETDLTSYDLLDNLRKYVYNFNPSKVIIQVGITDFIRVDNEEDLKIAENIKNIIKEIKANRPYAEIYIMSIYPINDSDDDKVQYKLVKNLYNEKIEKVNSEIKEVCKNNSVTYIDAHTALLDSDKKMLNIDYTSDGLHLSDEGYKVVARKINEAINK